MAASLQAWYTAQDIDRSHYYVLLKLRAGARHCCLACDCSTTVERFYRVLPIPRYLTVTCRRFVPLQLLHSGGCKKMLFRCRPHCRRLNLKPPGLPQRRAPADAGSPACPQPSYFRGCEVGTLGRSCIDCMYTPGEGGLYALRSTCCSFHS